MKVAESNNYEVKLYLGSKEGYHGRSFDRDTLCQEITNFQGRQPREDLVSLRIVPCLYVVEDWQEEGWEISCINYPRFPKKSADLDKFMRGLAEHLLYRLKQNRITVVNMYKCITFEADDAEQRQ